jgi:hypothetical protein
VEKIKLKKTFERRGEGRRYWIGWYGGVG